MVHSPLPAIPPSRHPKVEDGTDVILVIGGEGFLGHALLEDLHARYGDSVRLWSSSRTRRYPEAHWRWLRCDLTSASSLASVLRESGAKTVFLAAASHFESSRADAFRVNVNGTRAAVQACQTAGVRKLIYTSSTSAVFTGADVKNATEDEARYVTEKDGQSYYGVSKAQGEKIVLAANGLQGMYTTAIRPASFIGPGDTTVFPQAIAILHKHQAFVQIGDNTNKCDWDHIRNVNWCHVLASERLPGPAAGQVFHVSSDEPVELFTYMRKIWHAYDGYTAWIDITLPYWFAYILAVLNEFVCALVRIKAQGITRDTLIYATAWRWHNIDKAKELLGFTPLVGVDQGIQDAMWWYREEEARERLARARQRLAKRRPKLQDATKKES